MVTQLIRQNPKILLDAKHVYYPRKMLSNETVLKGTIRGVGSLNNPRAYIIRGVGPLNKPPASQPVYDLPRAYIIRGVGPLNKPPASQPVYDLPSRFTKLASDNKKLVLNRRKQRTNKPIRKPVKRVVKRVRRH